jgi:hypothetical protein
MFRTVLSRAATLSSRSVASPATTPVVCVVVAQRRSLRTTAATRAGSNNTDFGDDSLSTAFSDAQLAEANEDWLEQRAQLTRKDRERLDVLSKWSRRGAPIEPASKHAVVFESKAALHAAAVSACAGVEIAADAEFANMQQKFLALTAIETAVRCALPSTALAGIGSVDAAAHYLWTQQATRKAQKAAATKRAEVLSSLPSNLNLR